MPNFKMYLEIVSQRHTKKLSSKIKKIKKSKTALCREPAHVALGKGSLPRALLAGSRQRVFAENN